jgi:glycosyltransferase involved in cell wall biosynthesis
MRVGLMSYPMLFQRQGGLQIQVVETMAALNRLAEGPTGRYTAELVDPNRERLDVFDVIHVFSAINGNYRIVETACELGVPVVLSPLLSPGWSRSDGVRARFADLLAGRLTAWQSQTSYAQTKRALQLAKLVVALGDAERDAIQAAFLIDRAKIRVLPNGISQRFFDADEAEFRRSTGMLGPFVLMVGAISPYKNQLGLAKALAGSGLPMVVIGHALRQDQPYLRELLAVPGVRWLGQLDHTDSLLASTYAAASVLALPSQGEVFPLCALESLAAGTPVVMTDESALQLPDSAFALIPLRWDDGRAQAAAIGALVTQPPPRARVRALVSRFTWQAVACDIARVYEELRQDACRQEGRRHAV